MKGLAESYMAVAEEALATEGFESAEKAANAAATWAKKAKELPLVGRAEAREKQATELKRQFEQVKKALAELASKSEDPEANLIVGRFRCLIRGDWEGGLPFLVKSSPSTLQS